MAKWKRKPTDRAEVEAYTNEFLWLILKTKLNAKEEKIVRKLKDEVKQKN